ncbi:hypothetical protein ACFX15_007004 [Malus domestica]
MVSSLLGFDPMCFFVIDDASSSGLILSHVLLRQTLSSSSISSTADEGFHFLQAEDCLIQTTFGEITERRRNYGRNGGDCDTCVVCLSQLEMEDEDYVDNGKSNKLSAVYANKVELPELFDKVLLREIDKQESNSCSLQESEKLQLNGKSRGSKGKKTRKKKPDGNAGMVDLWSMLTQYTQAVASYDRRNADELLKQIRPNSSPSSTTLASFISPVFVLPYKSLSQAS